MSTATWMARTGEVSPRFKARIGRWPLRVQHTDGIDSSRCSSAAGWVTRADIIQMLGMARGDAALL